uniref:Uncharacterized protein n=1 Tax=Timema cristinae TaxID=61476 RepID=A0A7R9CKL7_TIMCR|nr:unnamed protein product [Timema cristinae]
MGVYHSAGPYRNLLVAAVFRLCEIERRAVDVNLIHLLSPEVGSTLMWFLRRWSLSYLLPVERLYSEMSMALLTAFGKDTEGALWTMNFLLGKIESNLRSFYCETGLIKDTIQLLIALCDMKEKGSCVVKSDCLLNIIKLQSTMEQGALPQVAKRGLFKALVLVGSAVESQARADYWAQSNAVLVAGRCMLRLSSLLLSEGTTSSHVRKPLTFRSEF